VLAGWTFTERELLEIVLVDSAANYASSLSYWAFGSNANYAAAARRWLDARGLSGIQVVEPVALDPRNTATAADLVALGRIALADPLVAELVATKNLSMHDVGGLENTNELLGTHGINGIKTGTLDDYGASLLFSADVPTLGDTVPIVGAVLGSGSHELLNQEVDALLTSVQANYHRVTLATPGDVLATYTTPWGESIDAIVRGNASMVVWGENEFSVGVELKPIETAAKGDVLGRATFAAGDQTAEVTLVASGDLEGPDGWWRLTHPGIVGGDWGEASRG
jgi:D-alanyl-D-alanine carboxypeptidase (penicillin-binding protein 5/6)